jgi:hypothetical protein
VTECGAGIALAGIPGEVRASRIGHRFLVPREIGAGSRASSLSVGLKSSRSALNTVAGKAD